jgi:uncharacterized SAM-binding protein YcdF (DUF218 family)
LLFAVAVIAGGVWGGRSLGHLLHHEDPLERADAVFVLGGSWMERVAEGGHLFLEGYARTVVLSHDPSDAAVTALRAKGIPIADPGDIQIQGLTLMGVPRNAIEILEPQTATAQEARSLEDLVAERGWRTVIVVTHKLHTTRARLVMNRRLSGTNTRIVMRATRYDQSDLDHWWRSRGDLRFVLTETQKLMLYWIGIAD